MMDMEPSKESVARGCLFTFDPVTIDAETGEIVQGSTVCNNDTRWLWANVIWAVNSNAGTGEKAKEISKSRIPNFPNFLGLVLGCIEAKFCK